MGVLKQKGKTVDSVYYVLNSDFDVITPQVTLQVTPQVARLLGVLGDSEMSARDLMHELGLRDRKNFARLYLDPALESGAIERTIPDKPTSRLQKYRKAR